jgi:predicted MFS family arabinose efflux permease
MLTNISANAEALPTGAGARAEWRRGRKVVTSAHLAMATGAGLYLYTSSLFVIPLTSTFGWSRGDLATGAALGLLGCMSAPFIGRAADRYGTKPIALLFALLTALNFIAKSQLSDSYLQFMIFSAWYGVVAPGCSGLVFSRAVSGWFSTARGHALGVMAAGTSIGALIFTPLIAWMIARYGFEGGFLTLAVLLIGIGMPAILWGLDDSPANEKSRPDLTHAGPAESTETGDAQPLKDVVRSRSFITLAIAVLVLNAPAAGVLTQLDPLLAHNQVDGRPMLIALYAVSVLVGRIGIGWLYDLFDARHVSAVFTLTGGAACLMLTSGMPFGALILAVIFIGFLQGMETDVIGYFVARHFSHAQFGVIFGMLFTITMVGGTIGVIAFGRLYDATQSYDLPLTLAAGLLVVAISSVLAIPRHPARGRVSG